MRILSARVLGVRRDTPNRRILARVCMRVLQEDRGAEHEISVLVSVLAPVVGGVPLRLRLLAAAKLRLAGGSQRRAA